MVVALMLGGLYAVVRGLARGRLIASSEKRLVTVLESTPLSQHAALHVVKVGQRYFLIGGGNGPMGTLTELDAAEVENWLQTQRELFGVTRKSLADLIKPFRGKS
ncbi:MAG TPA: flagellar biosynthetic protein FliO [Candidatus Acidoferrales bacterium]|nr:flagellar biosynthetic protein FliO [Candidatus Acidoferrales bacterium]